MTYEQGIESFKVVCEAYLKALKFLKSFSVGSKLFLNNAML